MRLAHKFREHYSSRCGLCPTAMLTAGLCPAPFALNSPVFLQQGFQKFPLVPSYQFFFSVLPPHKQFNV